MKENKEALHILVSVEAKARLVAECERRRNAGSQDTSQAAIVNELLLSLPPTGREEEKAAVTHESWVTAWKDTLE